MTNPGRRKPHVVTLIDLPAHIGGGAEVLAQQLTLGLDPDRFRRTMCVMRWRTVSSADPERTDAAEVMLRDAGVGLLALERRSRWDLLAWRPLIALLRSGDVDVVHSHKFGPNVWGSLLRLLASFPVLVAHEHTWSYVGQPLRRNLDRHLIARSSDAFLAVSEEDRRRMIAVERIPPRQIEVLPNGIPSPARARGVDVRAELGIPADAPVVVTVAILRPQKSLDVLLHSVARLRERHPTLRLLVAGHGPERENLYRLAEELALLDHVLFLGLRSDVPELLAACDVAVSSSGFEGSPLAVLEYMAAGLPIVATHVGGVPDLIRDGIEGLLVQPGDHGELADALDRLLSDPTSARRLGEAARRRQGREFTIEQTARRAGGIYDRLLARKGRGLAVDRIDPVAESETWDSLARATRNPFATRAWVQAWAEATSSPPTLRMLGCRRPDGTLAAILPMCETRRGGLRMLRFAGYDRAPLLGPVGEQEVQPAALAALRRSGELGQLGADVLVADRIDDREGADQAFRGAVLSRPALSVLEVEGLEHDDLDLVAAEGDAHRAEDPNEVDAGLDALRRLAPGADVDLASAFAPVALRRGWLRLWLSGPIERPVAARYVLRFEGIEWHWLAGHASGHAQQAAHLLGCVVRDSLRTEVTEHRLSAAVTLGSSALPIGTRPLQTGAIGVSRRGRVAVAGARVSGSERLARAIG